MKLITRDADNFYLDELKSRLEQHGIPAFIGGEHVARMVTPFVMTQPGLWIYLDHQLADATALVRDADHPVASGIDVDAFYAHQPQEPAQSAGIKQALLHIGLVAAGVVAALFALSWLLVRLAS